PWQHTKNDLDRPSGFFAVFKGAESDLPTDPTVGSARRSSDRFASIYALRPGKNWRRWDSLQSQIGRGVGEAGDRQHRPDSRSRHCCAPQRGQQSLASAASAVANIFRKTEQRSEWQWIQKERA